MSPRARSQRKNQPMRPGVPAKDPAHLYTLEVAILSGPMAEGFARANPVVARTIEIRGDQTLARLHAAIFAAFDRDDEHLYEFQIGGRRPMDPRAARYGLPEPRGFGFALGAPDPVKSAARAKLEVLGLEVGDTFGYWFDFGDDWWHTVKVLSIAESAPAGRFPRVTERIGESPPQYVDWDEEEPEVDP
jgi:Plasmid pRiA4b ORF-3-like protein